MLDDAIEFKAVMDEPITIGLKVVKCPTCGRIRSTLEALDPETRQRILDRCPPVPHKVCGDHAE